MSTLLAEEPQTFASNDAPVLSAYELERGKPMPSLNHGIIQSNMIVEFAKDRRWRPVSELTVKLAGREGTPDISILPRQPVDFTRDVIKPATAPTMIVEILSPTQGSVEIMERVDHYLANGVQTAWVVEPVFGDVLVCEANGKRTKFSSGVVTDPATGLTADLSVVFS
jgi:Uma2 family endonuclease